MNKSVFLLLFVLVVLVLCLFDIMSNKNKFRVSLLFSGFLSKLVLLSIIVLVLMEDIRIGIILMLSFFIVNMSILSSNQELKEGFEDYFNSQQ